METKNGMTSYEDPLACSKCYAKHLTKALVQWTEYLEDKTRIAELALCLGNIGCAEDHAAALRLEADRRKLRDIRAHVWDAEFVVARELQEAAGEAARRVVQAVTAERARAVKEAAARASASSSASAASGSGA